MAKAFSYLRFSTLEQAHGDSQRRQIGLAIDYCKLNNLELDTTLTFRDLGVSAFHGANAEDGRLNDFLHAVKSGIVPKGSYLLVESLDRISRQAARKALRTLEDICDAGIRVVTLIDGKEYSEDSLDNDPMSLMMSILTFLRANEESAIKSFRHIKNWEGKRERVADQKLTARCPAWLRLSDDKKEFIPIPGRVLVVQRIFSMYLRGAGHGMIAKTLMEEGIAPFGNGKRGGEVWYTSYICKVLQNPAVYGEFTPHTLQFDKNKKKKVRKPQETIQDYFPEIVPEKDFARAQELAKGKGTPGRKVNTELQNVFAYIGKCPTCGANMIRINKGADKGYVYLACSKSKHGKCPTGYISVHYKQLESTYSHVLKGKALIEMPSEKKKNNVYLSELTKLRRVREKIVKQIEYFNTDLLSGTIELPESTIEHIKKLEQDLVTADADIKKKALEVRDMDRDVLLNKRKELVAVIHEHKLDRLRYNALLRTLCDRIEISRDRIITTFSHGPVLVIEYGEELRAYYRTADGDVCVTPGDPLEGKLNA